MKKRKIISLVLALVLVLLLFSWQIPSVIADDISSTINLPANISALNGARIVGDLTINVTEDCDFDYLAYVTPVLANSSIKITVNGNNHVIKNLCTTKGFLSSAGSGSKFTNLGLYNCTVSTGSLVGASGIGLLCGSIASGSSVDGCFATGTIYAMNSGNSNVGGLIGLCSGTVSNSFSMCDIITDASNVGGLVGHLTATDTESISACYSTGSIDNRAKNYIGGLVGISDASKDKSANITNCYTNVEIKNPDVDKVNSIGAIKNLDDTVFYDSQVCLQRQSANDKHGIYPNKFGYRFTSGDGWTDTDNTYYGLYPQLKRFSDSTNDAFKSISAVSAAKATVSVDVEKGGNTVGREYTYLNTGTYSHALLTKTGVNWHISGGIDEYFFNPSEYYDAQKGARLTGMSGNAFDSDDGRYLFVNEGDVNFTAENSGYERVITVHVTRDSNPHFSGTAFEISNSTDVDGMRLYARAFDDITYNLTSDLDFSDIEPIEEFQGTFNGNNHTITGLEISPDTDDADDVNGGLFKTIVGKATITNLHISGSKIVANDDDIIFENAGLLTASIDTLAYYDYYKAIHYEGTKIETTDVPTPVISITNVIATGEVNASDDAGMLIGNIYLYKNDEIVTITGCTTTGIVRAKGGAAASAGGIVAEGKVTITNCYSSAVVLGDVYSGGIIAYGESGSSIAASMFTGMLECQNSNNPYPISNSDVSRTNCYYDSQTTAISGGNTTAELTSGSSLPSGFSDTYWIKVDGYYPKLTAFQDNAKMQAASDLAVIRIDYTYSDSTISADSQFFSVAQIYKGSFSDLALDDTDLEEGYTFNSTDFTVSTEKGGQGYAKLYLSGKDDFRYLYFNVKSATIYYCFDINGTGYSDYIDNCGSAMMTFDTVLSDESDVDYGVLLNSSAVDFSDTYKVVIFPVRNEIKLKYVLPQSLSYTFTASVEPEGVTSLVSGSSITVPADGIIYLKLTVNEKASMPWGNYSYKSN